MPQISSAGLLPLVLGCSCSAFGNYLNLVAMTLYALDLTGNPLGVGIVMAVRLAAGFGTGLLAGRLVTRLDRRRLMIGTDLVQALAMVVLALGPSHTALLACVAAVLGAGNTLFGVALRSSVPEIVGLDQRVRANGLLVTSRSVATILGFASAGVVVAAGGYAAAFLINAGSFLISASALVRIRPWSRARGGEPRESGPGRRPRWAFLVGLAPVVPMMVAVRGADAFGSASHNMALPVYAEQVSPAGPAWMMSQFWASWAVGTLLAHQVARRGRPFGAAAFSVGTCVMSACFVLAFTGLPGPLLTAVVLLAGLADGFTEIVYTSRLQAVPDRCRGHLFGLSATAETFGFAVGMLVSSALLGVLPVAMVVTVFHGVAVAGAIGLLILLFVRRRARAHAEP